MLLNLGHERDLNIEKLERKVAAYFPEADFSLLRKAYKFAEESHAGQRRSSGEEYIIHPLNVAHLLVQLRMDLPSIIAGLLHDVVEDCDVSAETLKKEFSPEIADIVMGLTKISKIKFKTREENQAENFRKMVVAMARDLRVIIVKLADRLHNMRTLQYISEERQRYKANETLEIYVPLASRLGINSLKAELEDLCLRYSNPAIYYDLAEKVIMKRSEREKYIRHVIELTQEKLLEYSLKAEVSGRPKHFYSIYRKMCQRGVDFEHIQDILAFRMIVNNITECYKCLGIVHSSFTPIPGRFKDYIAIQKANGYQSLHTTVIGPDGERIEIQIRTHEMHQIAETGIAAHWKYKESHVRPMKQYDWVKNLLDFNKNVTNNAEFLDAVKNDLDMDSIYVFTPEGDVKELAYGATPLDFAYAIHTEVGNMCWGVKVNGKMCPLKYKLNSGDCVEIITNKLQQPSKDWHKIVKTSRAKTKIRQWLQREERERSKVLGEKEVENVLKHHNISVKQLKKIDQLPQIYEKLKIRSFDELLIQIERKKILLKDFFSLLPKNFIQCDDYFNDEIEYKKNFSVPKTDLYKRGSSKSKIIVDGLVDVVVHLGKCCNPIVGDPIKGYITKGRGITIHTKLCPRFNDNEQKKLEVKVEWNEAVISKNLVRLRVVTLDRPGILSHISKLINNQGVNIRSAHAKTIKGEKGSFLFELEVVNHVELEKIVQLLENVEEILSIKRV